MRTLLFLIGVVAVVTNTSCNSSSTAKTFCDTACNNDSFNFKGAHMAAPVVAIGVKTCKADAVMWMHNYTDSRLISLPAFLGQEVHLNKGAIDCFFKDTSYAWLQFNDCKTGRGYLLKLVYNKQKENRKVTGAFTRFDPKFSVEKDLAAYTDRGSVFVENMENEKQAILPFDKAYSDLDFNKIHEMVDSVNITKSRIWVQMIRDGARKVYEKKIDL